MSTITDAMEEATEAAGKRDVPVRVWQQMRAFEIDRSELLALLRESQTSIGGDWRARRDALLSMIDGTPANSAEA